jgi:STE24 endopeptidase
VLFNARQFALIVLFPVSLSAGVFSLMRFAPELIGEWWFQLGAFALGVAALLVIIPRMIKPVFGLKSMPTGKYREQLEAVEKRLKFQRTDLLLWPTRGGVANAMIVGILPQVRYVMFTDTLLESLTPPELDAVFGHEIGHAHHGHLAYYAVFILLSAMALSGIVGLIDMQAERWGMYAEMSAEVRTLLKIVPLMFMGTYLFIVFGWLSRVCERQADIAGVRAGSCGNMRCSGHEELAGRASDGSVLLAGRASDGERENPSLARPANKTVLCETGIRAMVMALEAVMGMNGLTAADAKKSFAKRWIAWFRSWQHGPPNARIEFLQSLMDKPELAAAHDRKAYRLRWGLALVLIAIILATGTAIGWHELWRQM